MEKKALEHPLHPYVAPFTPGERAVWEAIIAAWKHFIKLDPQHPSHAKDFTDAVHGMQQILGQRLLQRQYPETFATYDQNSNPVSLQTAFILAKKALKK